MPAAAADVARHQMVGQVVGPYLIINPVLVVVALVFLFIKFPRRARRARPLNNSNSPTEAWANAETPVCCPRFALGILSQFVRRRPVGVWSSRFAFVQLVQQGTGEHSSTHIGCWLSLVIYAVGKNMATTWLMNRLNPAMLLGTSLPWPPPPLLRLPLSAVHNAGGHALILVKLRYGAMLADELWSGDSKDAGKIPRPQAIDRGDAVIGGP